MSFTINICTQKMYEDKIMRLLSLTKKLKITNFWSTIYLKIEDTSVSKKYNSSMYLRR